MGVGRVLIVGGGAREHAIAWAIHNQHPEVDLVCAPGNGGTAAIARNLPAGADQVGEIAALLLTEAIGLVIVGPDAALAAGVADECRALGIPVFGPNREAAKIEWSKLYAKELMTELGVPTARWCSATAKDLRAATELINELHGQCVVKADGLALGKGVAVCDSVDESNSVLDEFLVHRKFGEAGDAVVVEEKLSGHEISVFAFTDGTHIRVLGTARDYKRAFDHNLGPNTGGMGAYSPGALEPSAITGIVNTILRPTVDLLGKRGTSYVGCVYLGLMLTERGPMVLEYNARLGDPETQVLLPLIAEDPLNLFWTTATGQLQDGIAAQTGRAAVGVVLTSSGYPGPSPQELAVTTVASTTSGVLSFQGSTKVGENGGLTSKGGRVATIVGVAETLEAAGALAYSHTDLVKFEGKRFRSDIGKIKVGIT